MATHVGNRKWAGVRTRNRRVLVSCCASHHALGKVSNNAALQLTTLDSEAHLHTTVSQTPLVMCASLSPLGG